MKNKFSLLLFLFIVNGFSAFAQMPDTDIFLFTSNSNGDKKSFGEAINITNRVGYDNQPCFSPDNKEILFVSVEDSTQSEIWSYNIKSKTKKQLTRTKESEYSPTFISKGTKISTVRVDQDSAQRFYTIDYPSMSNPELVQNSDSIGYSCWINDSMISMFVVGEQSSLQILNTRSHKRTFISNDPGRCMKISPKDNLLYFIDKSDSLSWYLSTMETKTMKVTKLIQTLPKSEDFAFFSDGTLICAFEGGIFQLAKNKREWFAIGKPIASMKNDFYRIAISSDDKYIAVVSFTGKKP